MAEAATIEAKLKGEAAGLTEKAAAMKALEGVGQEHEEFVRELEADTKVRLAEVEARVGVATAQAEAMKVGLETPTSTSLAVPTSSSIVSSVQSRPARASTRSSRSSEVTSTAASPTSAATEISWPTSRGTLGARGRRCSRPQRC
ncbi:MAG: hypothetical protein R2706_06120 [Acidimicrobiales bacterium]